MIRWSSAATPERAINSCIEQLAPLINPKSQSLFYFIESDDLRNFNPARIFQSTKIPSIGTVVDKCGSAKSIHDSCSVLMGLLEGTAFEIPVESYKSTVGRLHGKDDRSFGNFQSLFRPEFQDLIIPSVEKSSSLFCIGTKSSESRLQEIKRKYPSLEMAGLFSADTPFLNGLSETVFFNDRVHENALCGIATAWKVRNELAIEKCLYSSSFSRITKCKGNIILGLEHDSLRKDLENFITKTADQQLSLQLIVDGIPFNITSGNPCKAAFSLDTCSEIQEDSIVQFVVVDGAKENTLTLSDYSLSSSNGFVFKGNRITSSIKIEFNN